MLKKETKKKRVKKNREIRFTKEKEQLKIEFLLKNVSKKKRDCLQSFTIYLHLILFLRLYLILKQIFFFVNYKSYKKQF